MRLKNILKDVETTKTYGYKNCNIKSITHVSKDVEKDGMFICLSGQNFDGNDYAMEAIKNGAKCIVTEVDKEILGVTTIVVKNIRLVMSIIAKNFFNRCVDDLKVIGIVGTSGKTTTSLIIAQILSQNDKNIGVIGTNGIFIGNIKISNKFTTPDPLDLHYIFFQMKSLGVKTVIMEVSAQAIALSKVYGINFDVCVFTNISNEHMDFFGSMEKYARCKMDFFDKKNMKECVVNIDDFYGRELAYKTNVPCISIGVLSPANSFAIEIDTTLDCLRFTANILDDIIPVKTRLVGDYNVYNILSALTVCKLLGVEESVLKSGVNNLEQIPGRLHVFEKNDKKVIVDFAHTPDSFEKTLSFVKRFASGKLITIFGCVGYSDQAKRIEMGKIASKYSDRIIITTDNRDRVPFDEIAKDVAIGIDKAFDYVENRKEAIEFGYNLLKSNDILCVLGKGAEDFQKIDGERIAYSDIDEVKRVLKI